MTAQTTKTTRDEASKRASTRKEARAIQAECAGKGRLCIIKTAGDWEAWLPKHAAHARAECLLKARQVVDIPVRGYMTITVNGILMRARPRERCDGSPVFDITII